MKNLTKALAILAIFALFTQLTSSQVNLNCTKFLNDSTGSISADNGTMKYTIDRGATWQDISTGFSDNLLCTHQIDMNNFLAAGKNGLIIKSTDAGLTWNAINSGITTDLRSLEMFDNSVILACGNNGVILSSTDLGDTWTPVISGTTSTLNQVYFVDAVTSYAVGNNFTLLKSENAGTTWTSIALINFNSRINGGNLNSIAFFPGSNGIIVGDNSTIFVTTDAGASWQMKNNIVDGPEFYHVRYSNTNEATVVGQKMSILRTIDGGNTWTAIDPGTHAGLAANLICINFPTGLNGLIVGEAGTMLYTNDGGLTWTDSYNAGTRKLNNVNRISNNIKARNFPNPFNPSTMISYELSFDANVSVKVYDMVGKEVANLVNSFQRAGNYQALFNASSLSSGIYFYRITAVAGSVSIDKTMRMILVK